MPRFLSLYTFSLPLAVLISIPLACTAVITTLVAVSILAVRVTFVYVELVLAVVPQYIFRMDDPHSKLSYRFLSPNATYENSPATTPTIERRSRRLSNTSLMSTLTPAASAVSLPLPQQSVGLGRDFEGVGGWRLDQQSDEEQLWTRINSRLELPAESPRRYHHQRSLTAGSYSGDQRERNRSPELSMRRNGSFSPNTKRIRTPTLSRNGFTVGDGYFGMASAQEGAGGWSPKAFRTPTSTRRNSVSPR
ncbi:hypothetical protein V500_05727 [Pseudogymnoascus sp. VKM F-4518 (FW-2643)]|nr:hypothetical protein V500_05727 [Pseudogymnoascus sp. VKM F-4518 (FW-2643)]KFZ17618.1 hypothetical protein V502_04524 [Pseudogymnoascus sp. VKM F-4520 (FW-2644)]